MTVYRCPLDSCGKKFETLASVRAHITGSGGEHKGLSGPQYPESELRIDSGGPEAGEKAGETGSKPDNSGSTQPPDFPSNDTTDGESGSEEIELPCGHESFDPTEAPEPPYRVTCEVCGEVREVDA